MEFTTESSISSSDELTRAQALLWTHTFNHIDSMSLKCAIELGIPDAIRNHGNPIALGDLLSSLSIPPSKEPQLCRLMQMLTHSGIFAENNEHKYTLTPVSSLLVENKDNVSLSGFPLAMLHPVLTDAFQSMSTWFKSADHEATPFSVQFGCDAWEITGRKPEFNRVFNEGMESDTKFLMNALIKDCRHVFNGVKSLVDVGGGTGSAAMAISEAFPDMQCSVLELPQVVSTIKETGTVTFVAGDMFNNVPPADAVMLKWILHDWNDELCVKILKRCKEAISFHDTGGKVKGKVIIIELVMDPNSRYQESSTAQLYMDILMMVVAGGAERGEKEWGKIFKDAGFNHYKITPAPGLRSIIEVYP